MVVPRMLVFTVQQRLTNPENLNSGTLQEKIKRNNLPQEYHPDVKQLMRTRRNRSINCKGMGADMAPQAKEEHGHFADFLNLLRGFAQTHSAEQKKVGHADRGVNLQIKVLVQSNNLFRLKDGLGPCLVDANNTQLLPLHGKLLQRMPFI
jgi:hypothetical protein